MESVQLESVALRVQQNAQGPFGCGMPLVNLSGDMICKAFFFFSWKHHLNTGTLALSGFVGARHVSYRPFLRLAF